MHNKIIMSTHEHKSNSRSSFKSKSSTNCWYTCGMRRTCNRDAKKSWIESKKAEEKLTGFESNAVGKKVLFLLTFLLLPHSHRFFFFFNSSYLWLHMLVSRTVVRLLHVKLLWVYAWGLRGGSREKKLQWGIMILLPEWRVIETEEWWIDSSDLWFVVIEWVKSLSIYRFSFLLWNANEIHLKLIS